MASKSEEMAPSQHGAGQTGIGIRRHFTEAGVDPYDTVEWERRDARIQNYKDGTDAFFQADVEFPVSWSQNATNIVAQKYFRGTLGTSERETSLRQVIDRIVDTIADWGISDGYFTGPEEANAFRDELKYVMVHQRAAFNSPVWFNIGVKGVPAQGSACFILAVEDTMDGILNWYREEGTIFKGGSGSGINLSGIRSSVEHLKGGGTASGPVSFMRGADASAGTIKSGGKTRRAAKMVILNADHPDIEEFVWCKAREEHKARALRDAGFDMDLDGRDSHSIQYQNANNSVRVTDDFMQAVIDDRDWFLKTVKTGETVKTMKARELMRQFSSGFVGVRRPGHAVRHHDQPLAHVAELGSHQRQQPLLGVHARRQLGLQPRQHQPDEVPPRRWRLRCGRLRRRGLPAHDRGRVHRPGDPGRQRRLPDREDRGEQPQVPSARSRLREPRRPAHGAGSPVRLARGPGVGGCHHRADDRPRLRHQRAHREPDGSARRATPRTRSRCSTCSACTAPRRPRSTRSSCRRSC